MKACSLLPSASRAETGAAGSRPERRPVAGLLGPADRTPTGWRAVPNAQARAAQRG